MLSTDKSEILKSCTLKNDSFINGRDFEKLKDPNLIIETVKSAIENVTKGINIDAIGITGQMH